MLAGHFQPQVAALGHTGLDPVQRDEMLNIIVQVNRDFGIDVMLSSHVLEEVERVCDHVVALDEGRLIAQGSMSELAGAEALIVTWAGGGFVPMMQAATDLGV